MLRPREAVLWCVKNGHGDVSSIACITTLTCDRVRTELNRLKDKNRVSKTDEGWVAIPEKCLLAEVWR